MTNKLNKVSVFLISVLFFAVACKNNPDTQEQEKELFIPDNVWSVPEGNDYENNESQFSYNRMSSKPNIAVLWDKDFGNDPSTLEDADKRFPVEEFLQEGERFYNHYTDVLKFVHKGNSLADMYKMLVFVISDDDHTAYGGGAEEKIGAMWFRPARMKQYPFCTLAHEMGHSFQYLLSCDQGGNGRIKMARTGHSIMEMCAQWMLWQVYPEWQTYENYHLVDFMKKTHFAFLHHTNMYHSPYVLEYWSTIHGPEIIGNILREITEDEDPVMTYKRITSIGQKEFNDEIFDACRRFITWDLERVKEVANKYANQHFCKLDNAGDGWFRIAKSNCPQNYGYNGIKLNVPEADTEIKLNFKGIVGAEAYETIESDKAGWRYGFVAYKTNGERVYSDIYRESEAKVSFQVPADTEYLWLVVSGAPTEHFEYQNEEWPYQLKLSGTQIDESFVN